MLSKQLKTAITSDQFRKNLPPVPKEGAPDDIPRILRPTGCAPIGPMDWMALRTYDRIIETREEIRPSYTFETVGDRTIARCWRRACIVDADYAKFSSADALTASWRKDRLRRLTNVVQGIRASHWHLWMCPIGPIVFTDYVDKRQNNMHMLDVCRPYWVCWADIVYLCHCRNYIKRFLLLYEALIWFIERDVNLLYVPGDESLTTLKHTYVFASLYMHTQVLSQQNRDIGGMWSETLDTLRNVEKVMRHRFVDARGDILDAFCNQFSVRAVKDWSTCGANGRSPFPASTPFCDPDKLDDCKD